MKKQVLRSQVRTCSGTCVFFFRGGGWARMQLSLFPILGPAQWMNRGEPGVNGFGALSTPADPPLAE